MGRVLAIGAGVVGVLVGIATLLASQGSVTTWGGSQAHLSRAQVASAPAWSAPCWSRELRDGRPLLASCARVQGRVLSVQGNDPDGDGDTHVLLVADFGLITAKFQRQDRPRHLPGLGAMVTVTGPMIRGGHGLREVYAWGVD